MNSAYMQGSTNGVMALMRWLLRPFPNTLGFKCLRADGTYILRSAGSGVYLSGTRAFNDMNKVRARRLL